MRLSEDAKGLRYTITLNEKDPIALSVAAKIPADVMPAGECDVDGLRAFGSARRHGSRFAELLSDN